MAKPALPESQGAMAVCVGLGAELARMKGCSSDECRFKAAIRVLEYLSMTSLPALLRTHSASSLLHSMLQALGASSGTAGTPAAWTHLASLLEHPALPATETLPLSLVPSLTAALESHEPGALAAGRIVTCLVAKFEGRYHPGLDSTAALVAALWAAGDRGVQDAEAAEQLGLEGALSLVQAAVVSSNNSKKVSSVLLSKLLRPLCEMAFAPPGSAAACEQVRRSARGLLRAALFDPGLLPAISDWASAEAKTSGFAAVDERVGAGASSAKARSVPESDRPGPGFKRSTTFKDLSRRLRDLLGSQGLGPDLAAQTLVWMLSEYSHAVLGSSGRGDAGHRGSAHAKGGREAVVVPFTFYAALIGICWGTPDHALGPLAALTASLGPSGAYQPSQDASRAQRGLLCALGSTVLGLPPARDEGSPPPRAVLPVLTALLGVEHGAVHPSLEEVLRRVAAASRSPDAADAAAAAAALAALVTSHAETRSLPGLLRALLGTRGAPAPGAEIAARLRRAVAAVPDGQVVAVLGAVADALGAWVGLGAGSDPGAAAVALACLRCVRPGLAAAVPVARACEACLEPLARNLTPLLGVARPGPAGAIGLAAMLRLYSALLAVHASCAAQHPEVAALPGQDVRADSLPAFFAALPGDNPTLPAGPLRLLEAAASVNPASQLSLASGEALAAWMALLHDWLLFQATTPSAPPGVREQAGAALTGACSALVAAAARSPALAAVALEAPAPLEAHATPDCAARLVACILCAAAEPRSPCHDAALALLQGPDAGLSGALGAGLAPALAAQLLRALPAGGEEERVSGARSSKKRSRASTTPSCWGPLRGQLAKIEEREGLDSPRWAQAVASLLADSGEGAPAVHMAELRGMLRILGLLRAIPESHAADVAAVLVSVLACLLATVPGGEALQAGSAASEEASDLVPSVLNTLQACCACDPGLPCTLEWRGWLPPLAAALAGRACTDQVVALAAACVRADMTSGQGDGIHCLLASGAVQATSLPLQLGALEACCDLLADLSLPGSDAYLLPRPAIGPPRERRTEALCQVSTDLVVHIIELLPWQHAVGDKPTTNPDEHLTLCRLAGAAARLAAGSLPGGRRLVPDESAAPLLEALPGLAARQLARAAASAAGEDGDALEAGCRCLAPLTTGLVASSGLARAGTTDAHFACVLGMALLPLRRGSAAAAAAELRRDWAARPRHPPARALFPGACGAREGALRTLCDLLAGARREHLRAALGLATRCIARPTDGAPLDHLVAAELALAAVEAPAGRAATAQLARDVEPLARAACARLLPGGVVGVQASEAPLGQSAPGAWVARCASALLAPEPDAKLAGTGHAARGSAPEADVVERCTLLRLLESLVARPRLLHFEPRLLSLVLEAVIGPCACPAPPSLGAPLGAQAALLAAVIRHRQQELGQLLPLLVATCRALLTRCATLWVIAGDGASRGAAHAAAAVMEQLAGIESIGAYLPQLLVDFIILVAADPSRAAWATLQVEPRALPCPLRSSGTGLALRDGAFALYGACSPKELQFLYLLLGRPPHAAEWREALTQLRTDYESMYKYSGKV